MEIDRTMVILFIILLIVIGVIVVFSMSGGGSGSPTGAVTYAPQIGGGCGR